MSPASNRVRLAVTACSALALALGFAHLQRRSFWQDEAFTWSTVDRSFPGLLAVVTRREGYQILHSIVEWPVNRLSSTAGALRTPSVLAFGATVPAIWLTARRLFDERTGMLAALLFAVNGFALQYAQEARGYMLATMLCAYAGASLARYVLAPTRWSRSTWIVLSALAIYAHGFAALAIGAQVLSLWFLPSRHRRDLHWIRSGLLIALAAAPAIVVPLVQLGNGEIGFIAKPGLKSFRGLVWSMSGRTATAVPLMALGVLVALVFAGITWRRELHSVASFRFALPAMWMILPSLLLMSVSYVHPVWLDRYALWSVDAVVMLAAWGLLRLVRDNMVATVAVVVLTVAFGVRGITKWYQAPPYQDYRSAMGQISARAGAHDAIIFTPDAVRIAADFYLRDTRSGKDLTSVFPPEPWGHFKTGDEDLSVPGVATVDLVTSRRYPRVWIVGHPSAALHTRPLSELMKGYRVASDHVYIGPVEVVLLTRRG